MNHQSRRKMPSRAGLFLRPQGGTDVDADGRAKLRALLRKLWKEVLYLWIRQSARWSVEGTSSLLGIGHGKVRKRRRLQELRNGKRSCLFQLLVEDHLCLSHHVAFSTLMEGNAFVNPTLPRGACWKFCSVLVRVRGGGVS